MKNILLLVTTFIVLSVNSKAQSDSAHKYVNHHRFEISVSGGYGINGSVSGSYYESDAKYWKTRTTRVQSIGLCFYPMRRLSISVAGNLYRWDNKYRGLRSSADGKDHAISSVLSLNYDILWSKGIFYGGANVGYAKTLERSRDSGPLFGGDGIEWNVHAGYKLALVKNRFFFFLEGGYTETSIRSKTASIYVDPRYVVSNIPLVIGLKFKV